MKKEEIIKKLESLMATVQMAHYNGRELGVRVHESGEFCVSIDLYHFEEDGKPVCEGLTFNQEGKSDQRRAFSICYDPSDENTPLWILCCDDSGGIDDDTDMLPKYLPEELLTAIATWLEKNIAPGEVKSEKGKVKNDVTSFFFYMWNAWCKEECERAFADGDYNHFWTKWCGICEKYSRFGAVEHFYAELSDHNRDKLVARALELYNGMSEK